MSTENQNAEPETPETETEAGEVYYNIYIYDNHGTINIQQTGKPSNPPPPPPPNNPWGRGYSS